MKRYWLGILLILLGVVFLLDSFKLVAIHNLLHSWWPVILIVAGILILIKSRKQ